MTIDVANEYGYTDSAVRAAVATGEDLRFRVGVYTHTGVLINNARTWSFDDGAVLEATNKAQMSVKLRGVGPKLIGSGAFTCPSAELPSGPPDWNVRLSSGESKGVYIEAACSQFVVDGISVVRAGSSGIHCSGGYGGRIANCTVRETLADGFHMTNGSHTIEIENCKTYGVGDDMFAIVSYERDGKRCHDIVVHGCVGVGQPWGRGITVIGGYDCQILDNYIEDSYGAGVLLASEGGEWDTYGTNNIEVSRNRFVAPARVIHDANIYASGGRPGYPVDGVYGSGNVPDPAKQAVRVSGDTRNITVTATGGAAPMIRQADPSTLPSVLAAAGTGDIIELSSGDYAYQVNVNKSVQLRAAAGQTPVIKGNQGMRGYPAIYLTGASAKIGPGLRLSNPVGDGLKAQGARDSQVLECVFYRCGMQGALVQATTNVDLLDNEFDGCGQDITLDPHTARPGTGLHSLYYGGGSVKSTGGRVEGNWIHDSKNGQAFQIGPTAEGLIVRRNTIQRVTCPAPYANEANGIGVFTDFTGTRNVVIEENIVEDVGGYGYVSHGWAATATVLAAFDRNAARRCASGAYEPTYGGKQWATWGTMYTNLPDWKLGSPVPVPADDSPLVGLAADGGALGAYQPSVVPPPPDSLPLTVLETGTNYTLIGWDPVEEGLGYRFTVDGKMSHTWDELIQRDPDFPACNQRFAKTYTKIEVQALLAGPKGDLP